MSAQLTLSPEIQGYSAATLVPTQCSCVSGRPKRQPKALFSRTDSPKKSLTPVKQQFSRIRDLISESESEWRVQHVICYQQRCSVTEVWGDAWCNGSHACFPRLSPMLECGFKSRLGLEFSCVWHFLKLVVRGFLWVLQFPPLLYWLIVSAKRINLK